MNSPGTNKLDVPEDGKLVDNIVHFARALRRAGLPVGPGQVIGAVRAVRAAGFSRRNDFYWTLHACFVSKSEQRRVFTQIFRLYWRDPRFLEHLMSMLRPMVRGVQEEREAQAAERRAADALIGDTCALGGDQKGAGDDGAEVKIDASFTVSEQERLRSMDFEQMTNAEIADAKRMISKLAFPVNQLPSRRMRKSSCGVHPDWRATMRNAAAAGGEVREIQRKTLRVKWPSLVALCDISGSMSSYSRVLLHFLHAVTNRKGADWSKVHAFTFGTKLTNITRQLGLSDVDEALAAAGEEANDWEGGTRIGECLRSFNLNWSRRVMGQGTVVLLITDGLESGSPDLLGREMKRIRLSSRRLIWINPLLRWEGYAPKARGVREMLPNVDCFRSAHNISSLEELADAVSRADDDGEKRRLLATMTG